MPFDFSGVMTNRVFIKGLNYRVRSPLNRVNFGVSSSPFLLAATIRHHIEKYKHEFPDTVGLLDRNFYVDDLISGGNEFEEALQTS
ncbi:integrase catalytic domain-containing protein [Trichonephila clavipes]|nr:integrase catalytic domain-containing protein [Trichonephila clavipes]